MFFLISLKWTHALDVNLAHRESFGIKKLFLIKV